MRRYCIIVLCVVVGFSLAFLAGLASHEWISRIVHVTIATEVYSVDELPIVKTGLSSSQRDSLANTIKITYVGDMCLLRDAIEAAYDTYTGEYNFDAVFKHVKNYWQNDDLTIGVLEGPFAGGGIRCLIVLQIYMMTIQCILISLILLHHPLKVQEWI